MRLTDPESVRARLAKAGLWSKKHLGQHFLVDEEALGAILEAASLSADDTAVEVGPGLGVLSSELLTRTKKVLAFEFDTDMVKVLSTDLPGLQVISGDVLKTAPAVLPTLGSYKVVANIPYQITTPLIRLFLEGGYKPASLTMLVQKEVGKRLCAPARTSDRGYLSVLTEYFSVPTYVRTVPRDSFFPPPKVESAVIHLAVKAERRFSGDEERAFLKFVHTLFINPRKQLKNVVAGMRGVAAADVERYFGSQGLPANVRAQELTLDEWISLYVNPMGGTHE